MYRTCIIDTNTNLVINIIDYEEKQTGAPPGLADYLLCVPSEDGQIGGYYENSQIINPPQDQFQLLTFT